ncbi:MAG: MATE family efflux transporter [Pseudomonadota bacterium]
MTNSSQSTSTSRRVWELAWPTIISNLLFTTVGFMHIKLAAGLGTSAVAAVSTGHRVFFLIQAILMGLSVAATALVARHWGSGSREQAELVSWTSVALAMLVAALVSTPVVLQPMAIAGLFGLDEQSTRDAARFIFWMSLFNVFSAINMMLSTALRATGDVITPLWYLLFSSVLNVLVGYLMAYGIGPFPKLGVAGLSLGGSLAAATVTVAFVMAWWKGQFQVKALKQWRIDRSSARQIIRIGMPALLEQGVVQLSFLAFFAIVALYGTEAYAAYGIGITLVSFPIVIGFGFGMATATLVGQQLGAQNPEAAISAGWRSLRMALAAMAGVSVFLLWYARDLAAFMIEAEEVIDLTVAFIYIIAFCQPLMAIEFTLASALRGAGDTRYPLLVTFCGIVAGRLLPAVLIAWLSLPVYWLFACMVTDYGIKAIMLVIRYRKGHWVESRVIASNQPAEELPVDTSK